MDVKPGDDTFENRIDEWHVMDSDAKVCPTCRRFHAMHVSLQGVCSRRVVNELHRVESFLSRIFV